MAQRMTEAERLRRCRLIFERGCRDGVSMQEAAYRIARDEYRERYDARWRRIRAIAGASKAEATKPWYAQGQYA